MLLLFVVLAYIACAPASLTAEDPLLFGEFSLDSGVARWIERFPKSGHEFWNTDGRIVELRDDNVRFRELIRSGTGTYILRLAPAEVTQKLFYLEARIDRGTVRSIQLSFENPNSVIKNPQRNPLTDFEARHPGCAPVLTDLQRRYGPPGATEDSHEERLNEKSYAWRLASGEMSLSCGQYQGTPAGVRSGYYLEAQTLM